MKEFFLILFFGKAVLLTPVPIDLHGRVEMVPPEPIKAITSGASIEIDVSSKITWDGKENILDFRKRVAELFPSGTITASLVRPDSSELALVYEGFYSISKDDVRLSLYAPNGVPTGIEFTKVIVDSTIELNGIQIIWKNYMD